MGVSLSSGSKTSGRKHETSLPQNKGVVEGYPGPIHATDYKPPDVPELHVACYCYGKKGSRYVEKLTAEQKV